MALINKEMTWHELIQRKPKRIHMIGNIKTAYDLLSRENDFNKIFRHLDVTYIYGSTEKGKTRHVMEKYGYTNVYRVTVYDHTAFDNYNGEDVIAFEEFRSSFKIEDMLKYLEGYPLTLPSRYTNKTACYTKVYIITNWTLQEQYKNVQAQYPSTWAAFLRRIKTVYDFDKSKDIPVSKRTGEIRTTQTKISELTPVEDNGGLPF